jgi:hypothetical protein
MNKPGMKARPNTEVKWGTTMKAPFFTSIIAAVTVACSISVPEIMGAEVVDRDRHLVQYDNGVVYDSESGLEWYPGPDEKTSWEQARAWVASLDIAGGGWRMPTRKELETLYDVGDGIDNITYLMGFTGYWIWSRDGQGRPGKWLFSFSYGGEGWNGQPPPYGGRTAAVREH